MSAERAHRLPRPHLVEGVVRVVLATATVAGTAVAIKLAVDHPDFLSRATTPNAPELIPGGAMPSATEYANTVVITKTPESLSPTPPPEPTATAAPTNTAEAPVDVPCDILPVEYCSQADVIHTKDQLSRPTTYIGFRNLPDNISINTDRKGQILKATTNQSDIKGAMAIIVDPNSNTAPQSGFFGRMKFKNNLSENVAKGYAFAYTDTGTPNPEIQNFGDYDLLFTIRNPDGTPNEALLKILFEVSYTRPAIEAAYQGKGNGPTVLSPLFSNNGTPPR